MKILQGIVVLVICYVSLSHAWPVSTSKTILIGPDTVKYYASFIHSSATIDDLTINFGVGTSQEELLRVPIIARGELHPQAIIRVTVGMNPPANTDNDPIIGISDGVKTNEFALIEDTTPSFSVNPCELVDGNQNGRSAPHGDLVAGTYIMVFDPIHRFGSCSTNTGFASAGKFNNQVDPSKGLSLVVRRDDSTEQYVFHYFLVEFL